MFDTIILLLGKKLGNTNGRDYKEQWLKVNPEQLLTEVGFVGIKTCQIAYPIWTPMGYKPK